MCFMRGRRCGCDLTIGSVCAVYIKVAASSPAWLTRNYNSIKMVIGQWEKGSHCTGEVVSLGLRERLA